MKTALLCSAAAAIAFSVLAGAVPKSRVFLTETTAAQGSAGGSVGDAQGSIAFSGGTSPQSIEVMNAFSRYCPAVMITASREKADYIVQLDHDGINPTTPFVHGNKVAVFDRNEDLIYSNSTRILSSAVKDACRVINRQQPSSK
jgi:hypothetical protein